MDTFGVGDRVRVDIPDESDPDHDAYHGLHGTITKMLNDDLDQLTGDKQDSSIYRVELETGENADFRKRNLRPPIE